MSKKAVRTEASESALFVLLINPRTTPSPKRNRLFRQLVGNLKLRVLRRMPSLFVFTCELGIVT